MKKVGVCEWCLPVWGPDSIGFAADIGFEGVQLTDLGGATKGFPMTNQKIREASCWRAYTCIRCRGSAA